VPARAPDLAPLVPALIAEAEADPTRERCGLVVALEPAGALRLWPVANASARPGAAFELEPRGLLAALKALERSGGRLVAVYHSHPFGGAELSSQDRRQATVDGQPLWPGVEQVVVALAQGRAVQIRAHAWVQRGGGRAAPFAGRDLWRAVSAEDAGPG
jgi:proteasome lid subunit RPN8/RPN11